MLIERMRKRLSADRASFIEPCLPSAADKPPSGSNWVHEIKHDGFRLMARRDRRHPAYHPQRQRLDATLSAGGRGREPPQGPGFIARGYLINAKSFAWPVSWHLGFGGGAPWDVVMNLLLLLLLALPFACLAVLSLVALLGVVAIGGTLRMIGMVTSVLGLAGRKVDDPWRGAVGDAHPLDYVEVAR